jgi:hypothetical protein
MTDAKVNDVPGRAFAFGEQIALGSAPVGSIVLTPAQRVCKVLSPSGDRITCDRIDVIEETFRLMPATYRVTMIRDGSQFNESD